MKPSRHLTQETEELVISLYRELLNAPEVSRRTKLGTTTIYRVLERNGIERTGLVLYRDTARKLSPEQQVCVAGYYKQGWSREALARKFCVCGDTIERSLRKQGITLRNRGQKPREFSTDEIDEVVRLYTEDHLSQEQIAQRLKTQQQKISLILERQGVFCHAGVGKREKHSQWRGGAYIRADGYRMILVPLGFPFPEMAKNRRYIHEHRLVMAEKLGRPLASHEHVHHLNGDRCDNRIENLQLRHRHHGSGVAMRCADCGSTNIVSVEIKETAEQS